jgi:hypothetical protein
MSTPLRALQVETAVMLYCRATATAQLATRAGTAPGRNSQPQRAHTQLLVTVNAAYARKARYADADGRSTTDDQLTGIWTVPRTRLG